MIFLLRYYKVILIAAAIAGITGLFFAWRIEVDKAAKFKDQAESLGNYHSNTQDSLKTALNAKNQWEATANANLMTAATVARLAESQSFWINQMQGVKKNMKNLESAQSTGLKADIKAKTTSSDTTFKRDTANVKAYKFKVEKYYSKDAYTKIYGIADKDSVSLNVEIAAPIEQAVYWDRKWFLGKKKYISKVISENPDVKIIYHKSITVTRKK